MKVKNCKNCKYCTRKRWSHLYQPLGYHAIGMTHAYAFCEKYGRRVIEIKSCEEHKYEEQS